MIAKILPSLFTLGNLFLGIIALIFAFNGLWPYAAIMIIIGMLCDGLDGVAARMLNTESEFGKELDSLSDMVTFGVAPAFIMYVAVLQPLGFVGWLVTAVFPACGAVRLARFNVKKRTSGFFVGLPITAAGGILATMALYNDVIASPSVLVLGMLGLAFLMVSSLKYPNFKKVGIPKRMYWLGPLIIVLAGVLAVIFPYDFPRAVFVPLFLYAVWGMTRHVRRHKHDDQPLKSDAHS